MECGQLKRRMGALFLTGLVAQAAGVPSVAFAASPSRWVVIPFTQGEGAPDRAAQKFTALVADELKSRGEVALVGGQDAPPRPAQAAADPAEARAAMAEGKKALTDLRFEEAAKSLQNGVALALADPAQADFPQVLDAMVSVAVAYFRMGEEKKAQQALISVARLDPRYSLGEGRFPPVFVREFQKARKKVGKMVKGTLEVDGPPGSTAFIDGRDLGMVPVVEENLPAGAHYVKVEGPRGERFGQVVELKGGKVKVMGAFGVEGNATEPRVAAVLDAEGASRIARYAQAVGAEFALVGYVYRTGDHQLTAGAALYSVERRGFVALAPHSFDPELLTAKPEAFKLVDQAVRQIDAAPAALPVALNKVKPVRGSSPATVATGPAEQTATEGTRRVVIARADPGADDPASVSVRAFDRPSAFDLEATRKAEETGDAKKPEGMQSWVWVLVGVGAAAVATGTYFGVSHAVRPVTGSVTASW